MLPHPRPIAELYSTHTPQAHEPACLQDLDLVGRNAISRLVRAATLLAPRLLRPVCLSWNHHACDRQRTQRASLEYLQYLMNSGLFSPGRLSQLRPHAARVQLLAYAAPAGAALCSLAIPPCV